MDAISILELSFAIGLIAGLRSCMAPAMVSWAARLGWMNLQGTPLAFLGSAVTPYIFSALAIAELVADKLPNTPKRTAAVGLSARVVLGGLAGCAIAMAGGESALLGALLGAAGGVAGAFGGYEARSRLVKASNLPDFAIALVEDAVAFFGGLFFVSRF